MCACSVTPNSLWPQGLYPTRILCPWNFPGKNTGVGYHFLLQGIFLSQGSDLHLMNWWVDSLPLYHPGSNSRAWLSASPCEWCPVALGGLWCFPSSGELFLQRQKAQSQKTAQLGTIRIKRSSASQKEKSKVRRSSSCFYSNVYTHTHTHTQRERLRTAQAGFLFFPKHKSATWWRLSTSAPKQKGSLDNW